ncbi:allophanate hydrolase subunit 1 [Puniceicoccaceae bacterium K14]|nr:allophanate hydrolase subunit 1 [Puniceicoccaceae bacterium K14]
MDLSCEEKFQLKAYGPLAWLVSVGLQSSGGDWLYRLARAADENPPERLQECVLGFDTFLLVFREEVSQEFVEEWLLKIEWGVDEVSGDSRLIEFPVTYGGADLEALAEAKEMLVEEVVRRHSDAEYRVRLLGFSPGFPYLDGLDEALCMARKDIPVPRIEAGAVAIGGSHAGIYSIASPGGWHVLGRTSSALFDPEFGRGETGKWKDAFALKPGDRVRFLPV